MGELGFHKDNKLGFHWDRTWDLIGTTSDAARNQVGETGDLAGREIFE